MATPLISESQKNTIKSIIDDIHQTFARNITVYKEGQTVSIAASAEFNGIYGRSGGGEKTVTKTVSSTTILARIKYIDAKEQGFVDGNVGSQLDFKLMDGEVRITVDNAGFELLKDATRCEFEVEKIHNR